MVIEPLPRWGWVFFGLVAIAIAGGAYLLLRDRYEPATTPIHEFEIGDDSTVTLHYTTGGCSGGVDHVDQHATDDEVVISLWHRRQVSGDCETWGAAARHEIELAEPLRGRTLLDGYCVAAVSGPDDEECPAGAAPTPRPVTSG